MKQISKLEIRTLEEGTGFIGITEVTDNIWAEGFEIGGKDKKGKITIYNKDSLPISFKEFTQDYDDKDWKFYIK